MARGSLSDDSGIALLNLGNWVPRSLSFDVAVAPSFERRDGPEWARGGQAAGRSKPRCHDSVPLSLEPNFDTSSRCHHHRVKNSFILERTFSWHRASLCLRRSQRSTRSGAEERSFTHRTQTDAVELRTTDKDYEP